MASELSEGSTLVNATDHLDPGGSVVRSGIALADAVLEALEQSGAVNVSLRGLKGASSSYFNVFLRRIEEGCGLAEIGSRIRLEFGSKIQEMVFERSLLSRGPRKPPPHGGGAAAAGAQSGRTRRRIPNVFKSILSLLRASTTAD